MLTAIWRGCLSNLCPAREPWPRPACLRGIARAVGLSPGEVLFLSDVVAELDAARDAGMRAVQLLRPGVTAGPAGRHEAAGTFDDITGLPGIDAGSGAR